ncbi:MAG: DUF721 domain-containing protein [Desulfarculaceae bacterium]|nr:DUF721 domain-containing protein [Desulfarculaceae bacterium]MCF8046452.1 DUF721 domain-containing protein [Desulfarculaceae bacterium]MCF8065397.1 DUF721 domain-containing protein [Desulfarculaceae bacterium]MCF8096447.1 DUF721 domain-containing protein [Desulfarculaceae bacterium]MCF8121063.1 DUF721 domain-containing protein [Desulfarculaceae bacterium]
MKRDPLSLKQVLGAALPGPLAQRLPSAELLAAWRVAAGEGLARRALPVSLEKGGILVVAVGGSAWKQELALAGPQICERLSQAGHAVQRLKLVSAPSLKPPPPPPQPQPELNAQEESEVDAAVAGIKDPELREALASLGRACRRANKAADK